MRGLTTALLLCVVGSGVRFADRPSGTGGSTEGGAGGEGGENGVGPGGTSAGGAGGEEPVSLTVCANTSDYGLNGYYMPDNAAKLTSPANFGPTAPCKVTLSVVLVPVEEVTEANLIAQGCDIFQIGIAESETGSDPTLYTFNMTQLTELRNWSVVPGRVVLGAQAYASAWGDVFLADIDIISELGGVTPGSGIDSTNDRLFANLYALLTHLSRNAITDPCP
jgi:hypothetical protein